jgi:chromosome segregation ATPase
LKLNLTEAQNRIEKISPAAGRESALMVTEIEVLRDANAEYRSRIAELQAQVQRQVETLRNASREAYDRIMKSCTAEMADALGSKKHVEGDAAVTEQQWQTLLSDVGNVVKRNKAGEEALDNALRHNKELEESMIKKQPHTYDFDGVQAEAERLSAALDRTHSALLEMQEGYIGERNKRIKLRRDLRVAEADITLLTRSLAESIDQLNAVNMALRGESAHLPQVALFRTPTMDLAERLHARCDEYRQAAEQEVGWRQLVEQQRDELVDKLRATEHEFDSYREEARAFARQADSHVCGKVGVEFDPQRTGMSTEEFLDRYRTGTRLERDQLALLAVDQKAAACGQPYPCEHAPDGGNHPVVPNWNERSAG